MGNWLRAHRKQVAIHSCVIVGFLLFTVFVAEPLVDKLEGVPGEAQLQQLELPTETDNIRLAIGFVQSHGDIVVEIGGWAFIDGYDVDIEVSRTYVVMKSERHTYVFDTFPRIRHDVTAHFQELGLNLDWAGFRVNIPLRRIARGEYVVGLYITKGDIEALQYTDRTVEF